MSYLERFQSYWISAFSLFLVLVPVWIYLRFFEFRYATILKNLLLVIGFLGWTAWIILERGAKIKLPTILAVFLVFPITLLSITGINYPMRLRPYVEMVVLVTIPILSFDLQSKDIQKIFHYIVGSGIFLGMISLYQYFINPTAFIFDTIIDENLFKTKPGEPLSAFLGPRLQSITGNPNNLGLLMLITSLVSFGYIADKRFTWKQRMPYIVTFILATVLIMLSRSRDDIILLVVGIVIFIVYTRNKILLILGVGGVSVGLLANISQVTEVFHRLFTQGNARTEVWARAFNEFGWGLLFGGNSAVAYSGVIDSSYLWMMIEIGAIGTITFLILSVSLLTNLHRKAWREWNPAPTLITITTIVAILGSGVFRSLLFNFPFTLYFWLFFAIGYQQLESNTSI